jgi:arabinofuranosyltransferase
VLVRWTGVPRSAALLVAWLLSSKALVDYTASGLENPLSYLLLALFYVRYFDRSAGVPPRPHELRTFTLLASLAFLNRPDAILLYVLPLAEMTWRSARLRGAGTLRPVVIGASPVVAWLVFATLYYGFPLPNTYYAKVATGLPAGLMARQGLAYFFNSVRYDPITVGTIALAVLSTWRAGRTTRLAVASAALHVIYVISIGGDFMSGRFFTLPFLLSAMVVVPEIARFGALWAAGALLLYNLLQPLAPIKTGPTYDGGWPWQTQNGIKDERGYHHEATNILFFSPFRQLPDFVFAREGHSFKEAPERVAMHGSIGMFGFYAGPTKHIIDRNALSDPLLARMPASQGLYFEFYAGHYFRDIPAGYIESCERNENLLTDVRLKEYYEHLRSVTRGPLFQVQRFRDIWALNVGHLRNLASRMEKDRPVHFSVLADNERFLTDVGVRDTALNTLRSSGRRGLLQYGPRIPLERGSYRARWVGTVADPPTTRLGFVDVIDDAGAVLTRLDVGSKGPGGTHRIAEIDFTLAEPVNAVEYRFYVNRDVSVTLERVELYSSAAIPPEN